MKVQTFILQLIFFWQPTPIQKGFLKVTFIHIAKDIFISHHTGEQGFKGNYEIETVDEDYTSEIQEIYYGNLNPYICGDLKHSITQP